MEYKRQELKTGGLSGQFETVENFKITKPIWKKSFGENFFLTSIDSLKAKNELVENVIDVLDINGEEVVINKNATSIMVSIDDNELHSGPLGVSHRALSLRGGIDSTHTGTITSVGEEDPAKDGNDVFAFGYIKLKLDVIPSQGQYITFTSNTTNLQGISTKIHYIQNGFCYIRGTNLYGTLPTLGEAVTIHNKIGDVLVLAEDKKLVSVDEIGNKIDLLVLDNDDSIIDIEYFNSTIFVLTKNSVFFGRSLINSNMNIYPLDFFDNMGGGNRILSFGKHLILFGKDNQVISPVNGTKGSLGYISNGLNYTHKLFSKYSALSNQGSLYILQEDKEFVKVDIISVANGEYDLKTTDAIPEARGMLDGLEGEVFISKGDRYISIINPDGQGKTISYNYNIAYKHWMTWIHDNTIRSLGDYIYGDTQFVKDNELVDQQLSFTLGADSLDSMKTCYFVKFILVAEEKRVPDYTLTIEKYIGGMKYTKDIQLKDYPINNEILPSNGTLGYEQFGTTGLSAEVTKNNLGYILPVTVKVNETADMFIFTLKSNNNVITYGGSTIGYMKWLPEVAAYGHIIK